jgi:thiol:disulfide interchange protein DsbD
MRRLAFLALSALSVAAAVPDPVAWKLEPASPTPVKPGAVFTVKLIGKIQEGWHMYSMKPMDEGPIATRVWIPAGQPFQQSGAIKGDQPETMRDPTLDMDVELYKDAATFAVPVRVAAGTAPGAQTLVINTSYQTCNNSLCLPPKTVKVEITVTIAK